MTIESSVYINRLLKWRDLGDNFHRAASELISLGYDEEMKGLYLAVAGEIGTSPSPRMISTIHNMSKQSKMTRDVLLIAAIVISNNDSPYLDLMTSLPTDNYVWVKSERDDEFNKKYYAHRGMGDIETLLRVWIGNGLDRAGERAREAGVMVDRVIAVNKILDVLSDIFDVSDKTNAPPVEHPRFISESVETRNRVIYAINLISDHLDYIYSDRRLLLDTSSWPRIVYLPERGDWCDYALIDPKSINMVAPHLPEVIYAVSYHKESINGSVVAVVDICHVSL